MKEQFLKLLGNIPVDKDSFIKKFRIHQGWWRTAVLLEPEGPHPIIPASTVCNTVTLTDENRTCNYLTHEAVKALVCEIDHRKQNKCSGIIQEPRIWNNLLSSQPLAFNFWGPLKYSPKLANQLLPYLISDFIELADIRFEWSPQPKEEFTNDNSAFDVMIEYRNKDNAKSILGLECKYTDKLNSKEYTTEKYREIFDASRTIFKSEYPYYLQPQFNQLFRNQLIAASFIQKCGTKCKCGLFCSQQDDTALSIAKEYSSNLNDSENHFIVITYERFIENLQKLDLDWQSREWSMMLWARYLGLSLSQRTYSETL